MFSVEEMDSDEYDRYVEGVRRFDFDSGLAPYDVETVSQWEALSCFISKRTLRRLSPWNAVGSSFKALSEKEIEFLESHKEGVPVDDEAVCNVPLYTNVPRNFYDYDPENVTKHNLDKSVILEKLIENNFKREDELLGEFQYAFIMFLLGESYESFEQWKAIFLLFSQCDSAVQHNITLFTKFLKVLYAHLRQIPTDLFEDMTGSKETNFVHHGLKQIIEVYSEYRGISEEFSNILDRVEGLSVARFHMNFNFEDLDEKEEDEPTMVSKEELMEQLGMTSEELEAFLNNM
eukprot:TRINITY_DN1749_c0_g1_i2.p1 TRINITY_DN1749_c0_g1~~TRINITY_DN1749_c0_g1_i2.p1  ORF type:complete len:290 (-),score=65.80 TRINITY_DN1749_c0_g1_i2:771-1640(-)